MENPTPTTQTPQKPPELRDIKRLLETADTQPAFPATNVQEQLRIVVSGGNASLYIYDVLNNVWRAATLGT